MRNVPLTTYRFIVFIILYGWDSKALSAKDKYAIIELANSNYSDCPLNQTDTNPPATVPRVTSKTCNCLRKTKQCYTMIRWEQPGDPSKPSVTAYRISFWEVQNDEESKKCHRLPKDQKLFNFSGDGFIKHRYNPTTIAFALTAEPVYLNTFEEQHQYITCPEKIQILNQLPQNDEIRTGDNYIFNCTFRGYPLPDLNDIAWTFSRFNTRDRGEEILYDNEHLKITRGLRVTTLSITNAGEIHAGRYACHVRNYFGRGYSAVEQGSLWVYKHPESRKKNKLGVLLGIVVGTLILIVIIFALAWYFVKWYGKGKVIKVEHETSLYISHCTPGEYQTEKLLKFAHYVESKLSGVTVIIDLTRESEINNAGGLSQWIIEQMSNADRILVVLSKEYLNALELDEEKEIDIEKDELTLKVLAEYRYITNMLHQSCQVNDKLILSWQGGKPEKFPTVFEGRSCYLLPRITEFSVKDNTLINFLSVISSNQDTRV